MLASLIGYLAPPVKGLFLGSTYQWDMKDSRKSKCVCGCFAFLTYSQVFQKLGLEVYSLVGILGGKSGYHFSDPNVIKVGGLSWKICSYS